MKIDDLPTYQDIIQHLKGKKDRKVNLLLGNGFSRAYDNSIFSYNALGAFIETTDDPLLQKIFSATKTKNFEQIMQQLDNFCVFAKVFSADKTIIESVNEGRFRLKKSLIKAVKELHPEHIFKIPDENIDKCSDFLHYYLASDGNIISTNFDLLLYWVLVKKLKDECNDGFGRDVEYPDEYHPDNQPDVSELRWEKKEKQNIFYLHGALHLFDEGVEIVKEEYESNLCLLEKIEKRMESKNYPIFVTAGNAEEKMHNIVHNKYLSNCYDRLSTISGSLITFGFNFGDYDSHIISGIKAASAVSRYKNDEEPLLSLYIGVYSDSDLEHIKSIKHKFKCKKVEIYNAKSANIW